MLDVGYILSGFGAGSGALEFMIIRTIGPLLLPNSTRRPVMNAQRTKAAKARGVRLGTPANLSNQLGGRAKGNAAMAARADCQRRMKFRQFGRSKIPQFGRAVISRLRDLNSCFWAGGRGVWAKAAEVRAV